MSDNEKKIFKRSKVVEAKVSRNEDEYKTWLEYVATQVTPNYHSIEELEQYLVEHYKAIPHTLSNAERHTVKVNVILNHFRDALELPAPICQNPTEEQLHEYRMEDTSFEQARNYPEEKLGLMIKSYKIPSRSAKDILVMLEMKSQYIGIKNASSEFANELILWKGVTKYDIDHKTSEFMMHAEALRNLGKI